MIHETSYRYYNSINIISRNDRSGVTEFPGPLTKCVQCSKEFRPVRYSNGKDEFVFCLIKNTDKQIIKAFIPPESRLTIAVLEEHLLCKACFDTERLLPTCEDIDEINE